MAIALKRNRLKVLRAERDWTGRDTARRLGWSYSRYQVIEAGYQPPTTADIVALEAAFAVPQHMLGFDISEQEAQS